jgi:hypothetical protein
MTDEERRITAKRLSDGQRAARDIFGEIDELRRFLSDKSVATLRGWGRHAGCPTPIYVARDGVGFYIGKTEAERLRIPIRDEMLRVLGSLPRIGDS